MEIIPVCPGTFLDVIVEITEGRVLEVLSMREEIVLGPGLVLGLVLSMLDEIVLGPGLVLILVLPLLTYEEAFISELNGHHVV